MFNFQSQKINYCKPISTGKLNSIYPYQKSSNDKKWIVKVLMAESFSDIKHLTKYLALGANHDHPFIIPIQGFHIEENQENKSLMAYFKLKRTTKNAEDLISNSKYNIKATVLPREQLVKWFYCISNALAYLENKKIPHGNIEPQSLLLDEQNRVFLGNVGFSRFGKDETEMPNLQTYRYIAPETKTIQHSGKEINRRDISKADVWSLGMSILDICLMKERDLTRSKRMNEPLSRDYINGCLEKIERTYGQELANVLSQMLVHDPNSRTTFEKICLQLEDLFGSILDNIFDEYGSKISYFFQVKKETPKGAERSCERNLEDILSTIQHFNHEWGQTFEFTFGKNFSISPREPSSISENSLNNLVVDLVEKINGDLLSMCEEMSFDFSWCENMTKDVLKNLKFDSSQVEHVQKLNMNFTGCYKAVDQQKCAPSCSEVFSAFKNLKHLSLDFYGCANVTAKGVENLAREICAHLKQLNKLELNFRECSDILYVDESIRNLGLYLKKELRELQEISIDFSGDNVTDAAKSFLEKTLKSSIKTVIIN